MATLRIENGQLHVDLSRNEAIGALTRSFAVPTSSITSIDRLDVARTSVRGFRAPGTSLPRIIALGRWRTRTSTDFVAVHRNDPGYVITLDGQRFARLIVSSPVVPGLESVEL